MNCTNLVRASINSITKRYFYKLEHQSWVRTDFANYVEGDRLMFIENGKRSNVYTVRKSPTFHPAYGFVVEATPNYRLQETLMLAEMRKKIGYADGVSPVYIRVGDKVLTVADLTIGDKGEIIIRTRDEKAASFELADDLPLSLTDNRSINIDQVEKNLEAAG